ncbi:MAG: NAD(+)/NADH kinase, partial [Nitrospinae bacterium]|nr:NAD(+)/NADH kinase [Nitrospinota bacterium]
KKEVNKVGIVAKPHMKNAEPVVLGLVRWLKEKEIEPLIDSNSAKAAGIVSDLTKDDLARNSDVIVVLGGDGTLIGMSRCIKDRDVPLFGINLGSLGFLTEFALEEMYPVLSKIIAGDFMTEERIMVEVRVIRHDEEVAYFSALNDIVINRGPIARIIHLESWIDAKFVTTYKADGLIISTPTGSTAYSLAAGGPIMFPLLNNLIISPICPFSLTNRPIIIDASSNVEVHLVSSDNGTMLTIDGQDCIELYKHDFIKVRKSERSMQLITTKNKNFFDILRKKMGWGKK